ncbi:MAG: hypothetical protein WDO24_21285 [Pseudomonadota bacterium]
MELAASYSVPLSADSAVFGYLGLPGEPALGPPTYMHRFSGVDNPEAPLLHHWLDSTHVTMGVMTVGVIQDRFKLEASAFRGREPDQHRWDIETPNLDSGSVRLSFNPTEDWALQVSYGHLTSPELAAAAGRREPGDRVGQLQPPARRAHQLADDRRLGPARLRARAHARRLPDRVRAAARQHPHRVRPRRAHRERRAVRGTRPADRPRLHGEQAQRRLHLRHPGPRPSESGCRRPGQPLCPPAGARLRYGSNPVSFMVFVRAKLY